WEMRGFAKDGQPIRQPFAGQQWKGGELGGRRILLDTEQGFGDLIQFVRFVPMVSARGAHVILRSPPELVRLLRSAQGINEVISTNDPLPAYDLHQKLMSLPSVFGTTLETIPNSVPYLCADAKASASWRQR